MSGGAPDLGRLSLGDGGAAAGASGGTGENNLPITNNPNGTAPSNAVMWGDKEKGAIRYSEFKRKMTIIFQLNVETGSILTAAPNSKAVMHFIDELYMSYLLYFKSNPFCFNTPRDLHDALFNADNQYAYFKHYVVLPNLTHNGVCGFPEDVGARENVTRTWLKYYA
jgi:hypothetical protein